MQIKEQHRAYARYIRGLQQPGGVFERSIMNIQLLLLLILHIGQMSSTSTEGWKTKTSGYFHLRGPL